MARPTTRGTCFDGQGEADEQTAELFQLAHSDTPFLISKTVDFSKVVAKSDSFFKFGIVT